MIYSIPIYSPGAWFISGTRLVLSIAMPGCYRMAVELAFSCDWVYGRYFTNYSMGVISWNTNQQTSLGGHPWKRWIVGSIRDMDGYGGCRLWIVRYFADFGMIGRTHNNVFLCVGRYLSNHINVWPLGFTRPAVFQSDVPSRTKPNPSLWLLNAVELWSIWVA